jgi:hypothetical protein
MLSDFFFPVKKDQITPFLKSKLSDLKGALADAVTCDRIERYYRKGH